MYENKQMYLLYFSQVLCELKRLVDNCLTDTKLSSSDKACPSLHMGEHLQLALSGHDGPWYLEKPNHLPQEYHGFFGVEPPVTSIVHAMVSPRSETESNGPPVTGPGTLQVNPPDIDLDNTSHSMMSGSEKDGPSHSEGTNWIQNLINIQAFF